MSLPEGDPDPSIHTNYLSSSKQFQRKNEQIRGHSNRWSRWSILLIIKIYLVQIKVNTIEPDVNDGHGHGGHRV